MVRSRHVQWAKPAVRCHDQVASDMSQLIEWKQATRFRFLICPHVQKTKTAVVKKKARWRIVTDAITIACVGGRVINEEPQRRSRVKLSGQLRSRPRHIAEAAAAPRIARRAVIGKASVAEREMHLAPQYCHGGRDAVKNDTIAGSTHNPIRR